MLVAFPLALPMGWVKSPPYFTSLTETACDLANMSLCTSEHNTLEHSTVHRLEGVAATPPPERTVEVESKGAATRATHHRQRQGRPPAAAVDVYVDDFLLMAATNVHSAATGSTCLSPCHRSSLPSIGGE
ncbi:hypothetical protein MHU86_7388 [Fragilaria crotonensis]|nr:hypothetical protein MHU86_7388 [Fragilaria crotonensis]